MSELERAIEKGSARIAVVSDVHGNLPALRAVLAAIDKEQPQALIALGDYLGGPHPNAIIDLLRERGALMILGNWDISVLRLADGAAPASWSIAQQFAPLRWSLATLRLELLAQLRTAPEQLSLRWAGAPSLRAVHGSTADPSESLRPQGMDARLEVIAHEISEDVLLCGHIHEPWQRVMAGKLFLNPGAVSAPLNGDPRASFATLQLTEGEWRASHHPVAYDLGAIRRDYQQTGFLKEGGAFAKAFLLSCETGVRVGEAFRDHAGRLAEEAGLGELDHVPDDIWREAERTFQWPNSSNAPGRMA